MRESAISGVTIMNLANLLSLSLLMKVVDFRMK